MVKNRLKYFLNHWSGKITLIAIVVFLAYFQTLFMYFWNDDNAIIFKLQHLNEGVGNLGTGIFGFDSPYRMVIFSLVPVYYFFGINATAFFAYGILFYFLAAVAVFVFSKSILKNDNQALLVSLVFAAGLIGAESLWRVYNSVHTSITIIYTLLFCTFYFHSINQKRLSRKLPFYLLALLFFIFAVQWGYVRAHGIILIALAIEILFNFNWRYSLFRLAPFLFLFNKWYIASNTSSHHFKTLLTQVFEDYNFSLLLIPLQTLSNVFIPDFFKVPLLIFLPLLLFLIIKFRSRILFFSLVYIVSGYFTYFVIYKDASLNTTHRYLITSLPGFSLLIVYIFSRLFKSEKKLYIACGFYIAFNLMLLNWIHFNILEERSIPTKNFYQTIKTEIKALEKNSVIYFDIEESDKSKKQFESFFGVGSMPNEAAIAIHYNLDRYDLYLPQNFEDAIEYVKTNNVNPKNIHSFFYNSETGLINTSASLQKGLFEDNKPLSLDNLEQIGFNSSSPFSLSVSMNPVINESKLKFKDEKVLDNPAFINYLNSKLKYYEVVEATSSSEWKFQEINYLVDNRPDTSWMSNRVHWHYNSYDQIIIDLKTQKNISAVKLLFGPTDKAPTKYQYSCSKDGINWTPIKKFYHNPRNHGEERIDKFSAAECLKIKLELYDTPKKDAPVIRELEVIESDFANLDFKKVEKIEKKPFDFVTEKNFDQLYNYFLQNGLSINICPVTDKNTIPQCEEVRVKIDSRNVYSIKFIPSGTKLKQIKLKYPPELDLNVSGSTLEYLPFEKLIN